MDLKAAVKQDVRALHIVLDELTETVPETELRVFHEFVNHVAGTMASIRSHWSESASLDPRVFGVPEGGTIPSPETEMSALQQNLAGMSEAVALLLWRDASSRRANEQPTSEETSRFFPVRESPRRQVSAHELREAKVQWEKALERGRSHRDQAIAEVGPVLTPSEVATRLGVSSVTVKNWRQQQKILGIKFDDHQFLYPLFQFADTVLEGENGVLRHFPEVLKALPYDSAWAKAQFFLTPSPALGGRNAIEVLRDINVSAGRRSLRSNEWEALLERLLRIAVHAGEMGA